MMPDLPPGQICYAAYRATLPYAEAWRDLSAPAQARWEAAAQAVLALYGPESLRTRETPNDVQELRAEEISLCCSEALVRACGWREVLGTSPISCMSCQAACCQAMRSRRGRRSQASGIAPHDCQYASYTRCPSAAAFQRFFGIVLS